MDKLKTEFEAAKKDTQRMDWLEEHRSSGYELADKMDDLGKKKYEIREIIDQLIVDETETKKKAREK